MGDTVTVNAFANFAKVVSVNVKTKMIGLIQANDYAYAYHVDTVQVNEQSLEYGSEVRSLETYSDVN